MEADAKVCLICGVNANKVAKHNRYNVVTNKKKEKGKDELSGSESDESGGNSKKKRVNYRQPTNYGGGAPRQTRNQNPKSFSVSLCKAMDLPVDPEEPFLQIFSRADYCNDCMTKVKDIHSSQMELEKIQKRLSEYRIDIELDMSKHLQKIPFCKSVLKTDVYERYKVDLDLILDFHGTDKNKNSIDEGNGEPTPKRNRREVKSSEPKQESLLEESGAEVNGSGEIKPEPIAVDGAVVEGEVKEEEAEAPVPAPAPVRERVKKDPNLKCPHCPIPRYFNFTTALEEHVAKAHLAKKKHGCDICERKFHSARELQNHRTKVHDIAEETAGWICGFCDQEFQQKRYLEDHLDRHQEAKPLNCQFCGRGYGKKESLKRAFQIYKGETVEPCNHCGRNLNLKDYLEHNRRLKDK